MKDQSLLAMIPGSTGAMTSAASSSWFSLRVTHMAGTIISTHTLKAELKAGGGGLHLKL